MENRSIKLYLTISAVLYLELAFLCSLARHKDHRMSYSLNKTKINWMFPPYKVQSAVLMYVNYAVWLAVQTKTCGRWAAKPGDIFLA